MRIQLLFLSASLSPNLLFMTFILTIWGTEPMNNRYLAPVYVPMMFILVFAFDAIFQKSGQNRPQSFPLHGSSKLGSTALMICLCSWLLWQAGINIDLIRRLTKHGGRLRITGVD